MSSIAASNEQYLVDRDRERGIATNLPPVNAPNIPPPS